MTEAWLLTDVDAIREAAGNPNGTMALDLPTVSRLDLLPDPKTVLLDALKKATGSNARRLRSFNERQAVHRLADFGRDRGFHALRALEAFAALENEVVGLIQEYFAEKTTHQ